MAVTEGYPGYDSAAVVLLPDAFVTNADGGVTAWRDAKYSSAEPTRQCVVTLDGFSPEGSLAAATINTVAAVDRSIASSPMLLCKHADMKLYAPSFVLAMVIDHKDQQQMGYSDAWVVQTTIPSQDAPDASYSVGPGGVHAWGGSHSNFPAPYSEFTANGEAGLGPTAFVFSYSGSTQTQYKCVDGALTQLTSTSGSLAAYDSPVALFNFPKHTHTGHSAIGSMSELAIWRSDALGGLTGAPADVSTAAAYCAYVMDKYGI